MVSFPPVSHQDPIHTLFSPIRATCPAHLILLHFITRTILGEQYKSFSSSLCNLLHSPVTSSLLGRNILHNTMFSNTLSFLSSCNVSDQVSHPYKRRNISTALNYTCSFLVLYLSGYLFLISFCPSIWPLLIIYCRYIGFSDWLRARPSGNRIPVGARLSAIVQTGPGAHPAYYKMDTGSFPGGKMRSGRDADPSPPYSAVVKKEYFPYGPYGLYRTSMPVKGCTLPLLSPPYRWLLLHHIALKHTTVDRTPLYEWSVRHRDLYLTKHNSQNWHPIPTVGFETKIPASVRPQNDARDRSVTEIFPDLISAYIFGISLLHLLVWVRHYVHVIEKRPKYPDVCLLLVQIKFLRFCNIFFTCKVPGFMSGHRRVLNINSFSRIDVLPCPQAKPFVATPVALKFH